MRAPPPPSPRWCRSPCPQSPWSSTVEPIWTCVVDVCSSMMTAFLMSAERPWMRPSMNACSFLASSYSAFSLMSPCSLASWMRAATSARRTLIELLELGAQVRQALSRDVLGLVVHAISPGTEGCTRDDVAARGIHDETAGQRVRRTCVAHSVAVPERGSYTIGAPSVKPEHRTDLLAVVTGGRCRRRRSDRDRAVGGRVGRALRSPRGGPAAA